MTTAVSTGLLNAWNRSPPQTEERSLQLENRQAVVASGVVPLERTEQLLHALLALLRVVCGGHAALARARGADAVRAQDGHDVAPDALAVVHEALRQLEALVGDVGKGCIW